MNLHLYYAVHWLSWLWECTQVAQLQRAVQLSKNAGATRFELIYHILNKLSAEETATALKKGGMTHAFMCAFFPSDGNGGFPMGDPLSDDDSIRGQAVATFKQILSFMEELRRHDIAIDLIGGPSCYVLGQDYRLPLGLLHDKIVRFYQESADDLKRLKIGVSIELLRKEEDGVVQGPENLAQLIDRLNTDIPDCRFGAHLDTFHIDQREYNQVSVIQILGKRITHLHLNGAGRLPPGHQEDSIQWREIVAALKEVGLNNLTTTYEPFCADVRAACPPLGVGLPAAVDEPGGIVQTFRHLSRQGIQFTPE